MYLISRNSLGFHEAKKCLETQTTKSSWPLRYQTASIGGKQDEHDFALTINSRDVNKEQLRKKT